MTREDFIAQLKTYAPTEIRDQVARERLLEFVSREPACFERSTAEGHVTASAWVLSPDLRSVLLTRHRKLHMWLQLGGHVDGESDVPGAALREAEEESGIEGISLLESGLFDVDVHEIPARATEPAHLHFDARYLLKAPHREFRVSDESEDLAWVTIEDLPRYTTDESMLRMHRKWHAWLQTRSQSDDSALPIRERDS